MKSMHIKLCVWLFVFLCFLCSLVLTTAAAQSEPLPEALSLSEAIQIALQRNPKIKAAQFQMESVGYKVIEARSGFLPQIYFSEAFNRTTNPMWAFGTKLNQEIITQKDFEPARLNDPDAINNFASTVSMSWMVYDGGQTINSWKQAQLNHGVSSLMLSRVRQEVIAQTATAYVGLLLSQENLAVVERALETATANLKMVRSRFEGGFVVKSDFLRAKVRIAELEQQRLLAESEAKVAQAILNATMGMPTDMPLNLVTPFDKCHETEGSIEMWINAALSKRQDLEQLRHQEEIAQKEIDKSKGGHLPDLQLIGNYEINSENFDDTANNYTVGAVVRLNLFSGQRISAKIKAAKSYLYRMQQFRKDMELGVRVQARESFLRTQSAWKRIAVALTAVDQAEENHRIVKNRYSNGLLTIVDLLDAEVTLHKTRTGHFKALHDYKVARIQLALAAGTIDAEFQ
ncbi:TolC family protein [Thermodesulfobacteriota bacterium]